MAEAEEVITDVARHATVFARGLWLRHRAGAPGPRVTRLRDVARRLDLLVSAVAGTGHPLRVAQPPAPATMLTPVFRRAEGPRVAAALPATDGAALWLPAAVEERPGLSGLDQFRVMALQQAVRALRGSPAHWRALTDPLQRAVYLVLEAQASDAALVQALPGTRAALEAVRRTALAERPPLERFPPARRALEALVRDMLSRTPQPAQAIPAAELAGVARERAAALGVAAGPAGRRLLYRDRWTGEMREPAAAAALTVQESPATGPQARPPRSATLARSPRIRQAPPDEDDAAPGAWMVQTAQPHEQVEDAMGLQRPTDRDAATAAEELADALSELPEARLVVTPGRPAEVLLSEAPPEARARAATAPAPHARACLRYPEWDCRIPAYRDGAVTVHLRQAAEGPAEWVERTLDAHRAMATQVRRRFEMLKARRSRLRRQLDGDDADLEACVEAWADLRAGLPMPQALYELHRPARRDMAILILVDVSGSTDGWVSTNRRVIDVEREALLLVCIALQGLGEPHAVQAFSGEGPHGVVVRRVKSFDEAYGDAVARRIASLEPEHYTRAGAALRHATASLMGQAARHRLLLLLSDGRPNDVDAYEGPYGVEDMRQAVTEARLQGVNLFCLTVDRQAPGYLPVIFGARQYALLPRPELLPTVLLDWLTRLVRS